MDACDQTLPNFSEIEQSEAELLRFQFARFGAVRHFGVDRRWIFTIYRPPGPIVMLQRGVSISTQSGNGRLSY